MFLFVVFSAAQDFPYHFFSHTNPLLNNPSLVSTDHRVKIDVVSYQLWAGGFKPLNDYVFCMSFSPDTKHGLKQKYNLSQHGLGAIVLRENIGPFQLDILQLIYAYHVPLTQNTLLSFGVNAIFEHMNIDVNSLTPLINNDPRLLTGINQASLFDGGFGATISGDNFRISFSVQNLSPGIFKFDHSQAREIVEFRKFFLTGNYVLGSANKIKVKPEITIRNTTQGKPGYDTFIEFDLLKLYVGIGYRSEGTLFAFAKVPLHDFTFSYTSENPLNSNHMMGYGHTFSVGWHLN